MMRWSLFLALAAGLAAYSFWLYLRVELPVRGARLLASLRAASLLVLLALLFDVRLPGSAGADALRWALLDVSASMAARDASGSTPWQGASARARELEREGWQGVTFGAEVGSAGAEGADAPLEPTAPRSLLAPALDRAVEAGVREVRVLSDLRFEDAVAVRSALASLPLEVEFEGFGAEVPNAGVAAFDVPDLPLAEGSVTAEVEIHAARAGDSLTLVVREEDRVVAERRVASPAPGLRARVPVELPTPSATGRVRYTASVTAEGDGFTPDDTAVAYAAVGHEEGALVLVSLEPDWEPRYLLPVLEEATGLPAVGYARLGPDAFMVMGAAPERGAPVDSAAVGRAVADAAVLVLHGIGSDTDVWGRSLAGRAGRSLVFPADPEGAALAGVPSGAPRPGEWYATAELPSSPIAGALAGVSLQDLPPLTGVLVPVARSRGRPALLVQPLGSGEAPQAALLLEEVEGGRLAAVMARGFWRWAARPSGRDAYRRLWSGVAGWLLAAESVASLEARPAEWVFARGEPTVWNVPADGQTRRIVVRAGEAVVTDTVVTEGGRLSTGVLPPGTYAWSVEDADGVERSAGRFDVAEATLEMLPPPVRPEGPEGAAGQGESGPGEGGRPLRTHPLPWLLV
ncbi:MAG TPA: hypothetical protein VFQ22_03805, partial [Longimicrobiales bacterium]|nr:hypothetical protein [Longimicrobiales bacterium]